MKHPQPRSHAVSAVLALALAAPLLQGCIPLIAGGVAAGAIAASDRRSLGTQTDDKAIGFNVDKAINDVYHDRAHVNVNPYNHRVLLTGEVPDEKARADVARIAAGVDNVREVLNEVQVGINSTIAARSNDAVITSIVKGNMVDDAAVPAAVIKVTTEANVVYLQGMVTRQEADAASAAAARSRGVSQVVRVFEYIAEAPRAPAGDNKPPAK
ncbi:MAG TPA: BON domain-containing protein [Burkholderiales bacterium]|jgi:osmotically-inducible protein OsmY|nr:BON domain-containing protein [Burkholderiales bacterium]